MGPLSPTVKVGEALYTSPLNPLDCLGEYKDHARVQAFFVAPEALAGLVNLSEATSDIPPEQPVFRPGAQGRLQPLIDFFSETQPIDYVLWWGLHYGLPHDLHQLSKPCVLMVSDWHDHYLALKPLLSAFTLIFCDEKLRRKLVQDPDVSQRVFAGAAYSFAPEKIPPPATVRDIDVLFVGGHNPRKYLQRNQYLFQLARLPNLRCVIASDIPREHYFELLSRSKIAFNHALRQEMNLRAYEAAACGTLLFVEDTNLEVPALLPPGQAAVSYNAHNLEERLRYYLEHASQRQHIAQTARDIIQNFSYTHQLSALLQRIESTLPHHTSQRASFLPTTCYGALDNTTTVPALRQQALRNLQANFQPQEARLEHFNALLVTATDVSLFLEDPPDLTLALPELQRLFVQRLSLQNQASEATSWVRWLYVYNLAWSYYLTGNYGAVLPCLVAVRQALVRADFTRFLHAEHSAFLLPLRYTGLHLFYQQAAYRGASAFRCCIEAGVAFLQGCGDRAQGNLDGAQRAFEHCIQQCPELAEAYFELATVYLVRQQPHLAEQALLKGLLQGVFYPKMWHFYFELLAQRQLSMQERQATEHLLLMLPRLFTHPRYKPFMTVLQGHMQQLKQRRPL